MLQINNLHVSVEGTPILRGISLQIQPGETHAIMGPNGAGKSTLARVLAGDPYYQVTQGSITFLNHDLLSLQIEERAHLGLFMGFQYPTEIPGITNFQFLHSALNAKRNSMNLEPMNKEEFQDFLTQKMEAIKIPSTLAKRAINSGLSGGEKKWNEALQMAVLEPKLAILDETDSGLDIDAMRAIAKGIKKQINHEKALMLITHYPRLLEYIQPQFVHVFIEGRIVESGGHDIALKLEKTGYQSHL